MELHQCAAPAGDGSCLSGATVAQIEGAIMRDEVVVIGEDLVTKLNCVCADSNTPPSFEELDRLAALCERLSSNAISAVVEWAAVRLSHTSTVVRHKTLICVAVLIEGSRNYRRASQASDALLLAVEELQRFEQPDDPILVRPGHATHLSRLATT